MKAEKRVGSRIESWDPTRGKDWEEVGVKNTGNLG